MLLKEVWKTSGSRGGIKTAIKYFLASVVVLAQFAIYFIIRKKREQIKIQVIREEQKLSNLDHVWEDEEISLGDFMMRKSKGKICMHLYFIDSDSSLIHEDEAELNENKEISIKLSDLYELNNCKLFTINEENEHSFEEDDELIKKEVKVPEGYMGHHI